MSKRVTRRAMLSSTASTLGTAAAGVVGLPAFAHDHDEDDVRRPSRAPGPKPPGSNTSGPLDRPVNRPVNGVLRQRRSVVGMTIDDPVLVSYRKAVTEMVRRSRVNPNDPTGWEAQARIHAQRCTHNNWYFFPWHRAYLLSFEDICRQASGDANFALPYWDWAQLPRVPEPFTIGDATSNPLWHKRSPAADGNLATEQGITTDEIIKLLKLPEFETFGGLGPADQTSATDVDWQKRNGAAGQLESGPHNGVHGDIGGDMASYLSPLDPIFWLHHCNVDRLWVVWSQCGNSGSRHTNTTNPLWLNYSFNFKGKSDFVAPDGRPRVFTVKDLQQVNPLGYSYGDGGTDRACGLVPSEPQIVRLDADWRQRALTVSGARQIASGAATTIQAPRAAPVAQGARTAQSRPPAASQFRVPPSGPLPSRVVAIISGIQHPSDLETQVRVFVNNRQATALTPRTDPSFVGTISFFGGGDHGTGSTDGHKQNVVLDLSRALLALRIAGRPATGELELQLVPVGRGGRPSRDASVAIEKIEIAGNRN